MKNNISILLISTMISTSALFASEAHNSMQQTLSSLLEQAKQQCAWKREIQNDYHVQTPWIDGKKLDINLSQVAHIAGMLLSLYSLNPRIKAAIVPNCGGIPAPAIDTNIWNRPLLLICAYRYAAGEQKIPVTVVD